MDEITTIKYQHENSGQHLQDSITNDVISPIPITPRTVSIRTEIPLVTYAARTVPIRIKIPTAIFNTSQYTSDT